MLNWKDSARTLRCVVSLLGSGRVDHVFVVDNESSGDLRGVLEAGLLPDKVTWSLVELAENRGFAGGVNVALQQALDEGYDAILAINNDAVVDGRSASLLIDTLAADVTLGMTAPRILNPDGSEESAGGFLVPSLGISTHTSRTMSAPDFITWACVLVRSDALRDVGLLDEQFFMYWEDVDMSFRLRANGWGFRVCRDATATHEVSTNRASYPVAIKAYHTWSAIVFARKHGGAWWGGSRMWIGLSAVANLVRMRSGALRGLHAGILLSREGSIPAYESELRDRKFGRALS
ncbi:GT2 family glycosyltransferase [Cryobacterium sp. MP_M5]|uniref:glycosyltransferase family 2 protein n=1 Tax=unclassified Cryobacterium TaxID=2649013 RepID=UPI0018CB5750|nr:MULTISPECIES: glycosyltransferase family 2 protein [unclassified Cryobacterium]MBG6056995.1 GT2 family glycosyltransferase [Cryobacterium sp. MP_M3]MEC5175194.1 GT2 family glycosyltransferase [Cryobacterium sp. MP_M5]